MKTFVAGAGNGDDDIATGATQIAETERNRLCVAE